MVPEAEVKVAKLAVERRFCDRSQASLAFAHASQSSHSNALRQYLIHNKILSVSQWNQLCAELDCPGLQIPTTRSTVASTQKAPTLPNPGDTIDQYTVIDRIGEGGMGVVYKAENATRKVAIKFLLSIDAESADDPAEQQKLKRFQREAEAVAKVDQHPNIVRVFSVGTWQSLPYVVFDWVDGQNLREILENSNSHSSNQFSEAALLTLTYKLADALEFIHAQKIIHRDIKLANILIRSDDKEPMIADFGIAKVLDAESLTQSQESVGSAYAMAPEQIDRSLHKTGPHTDFWALGVMLYELGTLGTKPFASSSSTELMAQIIAATPAPPSSLNKTLSRGFDQLVFRCLAKSPEDRFQTGNELKQAIRQVQSGKKLSGSWSQQNIFSSTSRHLRGRLGLILISLSVLISASLMALAYTHHHNEEPEYNLARKLNPAITAYQSRSSTLHNICEQRLLDHLININRQAADANVLRKSGLSEYQTLLDTAFQDDGLTRAFLKRVTTVKAAKAQKVRHIVLSQLFNQRLLHGQKAAIDKVSAIVERAFIGDLNTPAQLLESLRKLQDRANVLENNQFIVIAVKLLKDQPQLLLSELNHSRLDAGVLTQLQFRAAVKLLQIELAKRTSSGPVIQRSVNVISNNQTELNCQLLNSSLQQSLDNCDKLVSRANFYKRYQSLRFERPELPAFLPRPEQCVELAKYYEDNGELVLSILIGFLCELTYPKTEFPLNLRNMFAEARFYSYWIAAKRSPRISRQIAHVFATICHHGGSQLLADRRLTRELLALLPASAWGPNSSHFLNLFYIHKEFHEAGSDLHDRQSPVTVKLLNRIDRALQNNKITVQESAVLYRFRGYMSIQAYGEKLSPQELIRKVSSDLRLKNIQFDTRPHSLLKCYYRAYGNTWSCEQRLKHLDLCEQWCTIICNPEQIQRANKKRKPRQLLEFEDKLAVIPYYTWLAIQRSFVYFQQKRYQQVIDCCSKIWPYTNYRARASVGDVFVKSLLALNQRSRAERLVNELKSKDDEDLKRRLLRRLKK